MSEVENLQKKLELQNNKNKDYEKLKIFLKKQYDQIKKYVKNNDQNDYLNKSVIENTIRKINKKDYTYLSEEEIKNYVEGELDLLNRRNNSEKIDLTIDKVSTTNDPIIQKKVQSENTLMKPNNNETIVKSKDTQDDEQFLVDPNPDAYIRSPGTPGFGNTNKKNTTPKNKDTQVIQQKKPFKNTNSIIQSKKVSSSSVDSSNKINNYEELDKKLDAYLNKQDNIKLKNYDNFMKFIGKTNTYNPFNNDSMEKSAIDRKVKVSLTSYIENHIKGYFSSNKNIPITRNNINLVNNKVTRGYGNNTDENQINQGYNNDDDFLKKFLEKGTDVAKRFMNKLSNLAIDRLIQELEVFFEGFENFIESHEEVIETVFEKNPEVIESVIKSVSDIKNKSVGMFNEIKKLFLEIIGKLKILVDDHQEDINVIKQTLQNNLLEIKESDVYQTFKKLIYGRVKDSQKYFDLIEKLDFTEIISENNLSALDAFLQIKRSENSVSGVPGVPGVPGDILDEIANGKGVRSFNALKNLAKNVGDTGYGRGENVFSNMGRKSDIPSEQGNYDPHNKKNLENKSPNNYLENIPERVGKDIEKFKNMGSDAMKEVTDLAKDATAMIDKLPIGAIMKIPGMKTIVKSLIDKKLNAIIDTLKENICAIFKNNERNITHMVTKKLLAELDVHSKFFQERNQEAFDKLVDPVNTNSGVTEPEEIENNIFYKIYNNLILGLPLKQGDQNGIIEAYKEFQQKNVNVKKNKTDKARNALFGPDNIAVKGGAGGKNDKKNEKPDKDAVNTTADIKASIDKYMNKKTGQSSEQTSTKEDGKKDDAKQISTEGDENKEGDEKTSTEGDEKSAKKEDDIIGQFINTKIENLNIEFSENQKQLIFEKVFFGLNNPSILIIKFLYYMNEPDRKAFVEYLVNNLLVGKNFKKNVDDVFDLGKGEEKKVIKLNDGNVDAPEWPTEIKLGSIQEKLNDYKTALFANASVNKNEIMFEKNIENSPPVVEATVVPNDDTSNDSAIAHAIGDGEDQNLPLADAIVIGDNYGNKNIDLRGLKGGYEKYIHKRRKTFRKKSKKGKRKNKTYHRSSVLLV